MGFGDPRWLFGLIALLPLAALEARAARRRGRALRELAGQRVAHALLAQVSTQTTAARAALRLAAFALLVLGASSPEWGREAVRRTGSGSDIVVIVDVSASMDARDVPPSRLDEARREALAVLDRVGESRVAVIAFAGDAVRLCPLTTDHAAARLVLEGLSSGSISEPGSDLGRALRTALKALPRGRRQEQAVVLWTDGEDLERGALGMIDEIVASGVRVLAAGVGTPAGDVVPVLDDDGHVQDVKRDESGNAVQSRLDEELLRTLAGRSRGAYFAAHRPGGELPRLLAVLASLAHAGRGERLVERPIARFPLCAALAVVLLGIERVIARRRRVAASKDAPLANERGAAAAALVLLVLGPLGAGPVRAQSDWAKGDRAFKRGQFVSADSLYARRMAGGHAPPAVAVNRATVRALAGDVAHATAELERLVGASGRAGIDAGFNFGTVLGRQQQVDPALKALRQVLERAPKDEDARWNYELLARRKAQQEQKKSPPEPRPQQPQPGGGGQAPQQPHPGQGPAPRPASSTAPPASVQGAAGMTRTQAEQLLNALDQMARAERQRQKRVRVLSAKHGRDW